jgi:hypothetical protein
MALCRTLMWTKQKNDSPMPGPMLRKGGSPPVAASSWSRHRRGSTLSLRVPRAAFLAAAVFIIGKTSSIASATR